MWLTRRGQASSRTRCAAAPPVATAATRLSHQEAMRKSGRCSPPMTQRSPKMLEVHAKRRRLLADASATSDSPWKAQAQQAAAKGHSERRHESNRTRKRSNPLREGDDMDRHHERANALRRALDAKLDAACGPLLEDSFASLAIKVASDTCSRDPGAAVDFGLQKLAEQVKTLAEVRSFVDEQFSADLIGRTRACRSITQKLLQSFGPRADESAAAGGKAASSKAARGNTSAAGATGAFSAMKNATGSGMRSRQQADPAQAPSAKLALAPFRSKSHSVCR